MLDVETSEEISPPVQAVIDLATNFSAEHFVFAIGELKKVIAHVVAEDNSSDQQIARVRILRYLDLQLGRAARWINDDADLMALVLRSLIDLRFWAKYVSTGPVEATRFLSEADTDSVELYRLMQKAFPEDIEIIETPEVQKRIGMERVAGEEEVLYKLCSKFIHPSSLVLHDVKNTILSEEHRKMFAIKVLYYGWGIMQMFHSINWIE